MRWTALDFITEKLEVPIYRQSKEKVYLRLKYFSFCFKTKELNKNSPQQCNFPITKWKCPTITAKS